MKKLLFSFAVVGLSVSKIRGNQKRQGDLPVAAFIECKARPKVSVSG
jgi:hypothetical protein